MFSAADLAEAFRRNTSVIKQQTKGLDPAQCLLQPPFRGNCMNWVIGHIVDDRNRIIQVLGAAPVMPEKEVQAYKRYSHGSEPICCDAADVIPLQKLLADLDKTQEAIDKALPSASAKALGQEMEFAGRKRTAGDTVFFLYYHDTYHTGQTELLRQLAGTNDHVI
jgi:hypothetical protein